MYKLKGLCVKIMNGCLQCSNYSKKDEKIESKQSLQINDKERDALDEERVSWI